MAKIIEEIRRGLRKIGDPKLKESGQRFFKEKVKMYGTKTIEVSNMGKIYNKEILAMDKGEVFGLCEELWRSGYMEESFIACSWSHLIHKKYQPGDFKVFENWVGDYVSNWASCDVFCNHTVGAFVEMYPEYLKNLIGWTASENRWVKRAAAVSLIIPARHGKFLKEVFAIADRLLLDDDDLVQKGYGWMLKAASKAHQREVFEYVMANKDRMPRTALRYAIEKMPKELKTQAMAK